MDRKHGSYRFARSVKIYATRWQKRGYEVKQRRV